MGGLDLVDAPGSAELQLTKEMATATMRTTTAAAITTVAIAVKQQPKMEQLGQNSANNANAWTLRISLITAPNVTKAKINVVRQNSKAMETVTTKTTTVVAITTAVIAARKHSRRQLKKNTAKSASAWIRRANKLCFFFATRFFLRFILRY